MATLKVWTSCFWRKHRLHWKAGQYCSGTLKRTQHLRGTCSSSLRSPVITLRNALAQAPLRPLPTRSQRWALAPVGASCRTDSGRTAPATKASLRILSAAAVAADFGPLPCTSTCTCTRRRALERASYRAAASTAAALVAAAIAAAASAATAIAPATVDAPSSAPLAERPPARLPPSSPPPSPRQPLLPPPSRQPPSTRPRARLLSSGRQLGCRPRRRRHCRRSIGCRRHRTSNRRRALARASYRAAALSAAALVAAATAAAASAAAAVASATIGAPSRAPSIELPKSRLPPSSPPPSEPHCRRRCGVQTRTPLPHRSVGTAPCCLSIGRLDVRPTPQSPPPPSRSLAVRAASSGLAERRWAGG